MAGTSLVAALIGGGIGAAAAGHDGEDTGSGHNNVAALSGASTQAATGAEQVAQAVTPSVVLLQVSGTQGADEGSGVILNKDGTILTNNHVVAAAASGGKIRAVLSDGSSANVTSVGRDPVTDLAVVQAHGLRNLTPAQLGDSAKLRVGEPVVAIGAPLGLQGTVTSGIVSTLNRPVSSTGETGQATVVDAIQTDAAINPGNSGGPLVDMAGHVVGIDSSIATLGSSTGSQSGSIGVGFAIPINQITRVVDQIESGETVTHAQLGVTVSDASGAPGALVRSLKAGSPALRAGLKTGDVITRVDDQVINNADALVAAIRSHAPRDTVTVTYQRDGNTDTTQATLGSDAPAA